jgi:hypothetical protein
MFGVGCSMFDVHPFSNASKVHPAQKQLSAWRTFWGTGLITGPLVVGRKLIVGQLPATAYFFKLQGHLGLNALFITGSAIPDAGPGPMVSGAEVNDIAGIQADQVFAVKTVADSLFAIFGIMVTAGGAGGTTINENQADNGRG